MPTVRYALEPKGPKRVEVSWGWGAFYKNGSVRVDGSVVGSFSGQSDLKSGRDYQLADGSTLHLQLNKSFLTQELGVLRNGLPLPSSPTDPAQRLSTAYGILFFLGALNVILGLVAVIGQVDLLSQVGIGAGSIVEGIILLVLGYFVRRRSTVALVLGVILLVLDLVATLAAAGSGSGGIVGGLLVRLIFLYYLVRGFSALNALKTSSR